MPTQQIKAISYLTFISFRFVGTTTMWSSLLHFFFALSTTMGEGYYTQGASICYSNAEGKDNIVVKLMINGSTSLASTTIIGVMYNWEVINECCAFIMTLK